MSEEIRYVAVNGMLGYGYPLDSLDKGMLSEPSFLGVDAGSVDPGPYYLGSGTPFVKPAQIRRDLVPALIASRRAGVPLIIGTAGGSGAKAQVDLFLTILRDAAKEHNLHFRLAVIDADIDAETVVHAYRNGRISSTAFSGELTEERIRSCSALVGQMGTEPLIQALDAGADVIVAGRCCDTAIFSAYPIMKGFDPGLALHAAKIAECGTLCARPAGANDSLICTLRRDHFIVEPANPAKRCFPDSVAAHSLYEQPNPDFFVEPEGRVDLSGCSFDQVGERSVRVSGSRLIPASKKTIKIEGAELKGYRSISIAGVCDPLVIHNLDFIESRVVETVADNLHGRPENGDYSLRFLKYGIDGVKIGSAGLPDVLPSEAGIVIETIAPTQEDADTILSMARSTALHQHFDVRKTTAGNLAFPFSPSDFRGGPVYEFSVYHLMETDEADIMFPVTYEDL